MMVRVTSTLQVNLLFQKTVNERNQIRFRLKL